MKKTLTLLLLLILFLAFPALAEEAEDLTAFCTFTVASKGWTMERLFDRDWETYWNGEIGGKTVTIKSPEPIHGLYICWMDEPGAWTLEEKTGGEWVSTDFAPGLIQHQYYPLDGATELRLKPSGSNRKWFGMEEIFVLGEGDVPSFVQQWQQPGNACDLLLFFAHPDDEVLFFGGTLPVYAGEKRLDVVAGVLTPATRTRKSELLNSLWAMGVTNYPVFGPFHDSFSAKLDKAYEEFGKTKARRFAVELFRAYRPSVVVTHDLQGEYGHGMHSLCADTALYAFDAAADAAIFAGSADQHGTWEVSKLYLHLYPENPLVMDWDLPLTAFDGKTGFEVAQAAYLYHVSQQRYEQFGVEPRSSQYSSYHFGLAKTRVGPDQQKNDFMENTPEGTMQVNSL